MDASDTLLRRSTLSVELEEKLAEKANTDLPQVAIKIFTAIGILIILGISGALGYLIFQTAKAIPTVFSQLDPTVFAALIAASATVLTTVLAHLIERYIAKSRDIREAHRKYKTELYKGFFRNIMGPIQTTVNEKNKAQKAKQQKELVQNLQQFSRELILWAAPPVITGFKTMIRKASENPKEAMVNLDDLMREIRKDLGHSNKGLSRGDLFKLFLRDPEILDEVLHEMEDKGK